jgi:putative ABC transport system permease protein
VLLLSVMRFLLSLAWRDLRASGRALWVFCACLMLGVSLVAAGGGLYRQISSNLQADARALFGGDLEVQHDQPLGAGELAWMRERGVVSLLLEFRTMLRTADERSQLVELQSFDEHYPLYGSVELNPPLALAEALAVRDGRWGVAVDGALAQRLGLRAGDRVMLGDSELVVRALISRQPDRSLRADWSGAPVLMSAGALAATGLMQPGSRVEYRYRIRTDEPPVAWRAALLAAFPQGDWEVRTFAERSERMAEVLAQIGSGLLLIGFSALFIGGLGVFNSVHAYLQGKLGTLATLRALGLRDRRLAALYVCQLLMLAGGASFAGALLGGALALAGTALAAEGLPLAPALGQLAWPLLLAWGFGVLTAITFALPALGRAVSVSPAALFRGLHGAETRVSAGWWRLTAACIVIAAMLLVAVMPDPRFGAAFVLAVLLILAFLEGGVRLLRAAARALMRNPQLIGRFEWRLAIAGIGRPDSPLRPALISLGSALTLLVASTLVVAALLRTINETVPESAPALVFYDVQAAQIEDLRMAVGKAASLERLDLAPLVLGRLVQVNGAALRDSGDTQRAMEARDEHKLSNRAGNFDDVVIDRGTWWPQGHRGPPLVAMEDREADQLGLQVGDRLQFNIMGTAVDAQLAAIYSQRRFQSRLWLEAIFSDGVLDPHITRYVGAAYMSAEDALPAQNRIAAAMPNVITVRTAGILNEARTLLGRAGTGLAVVAGVSLLASLLVLASAMAAGRARQVYESSVLNTLGARISAVRRSLQLEYALLALLTSVFAIVVGSMLAMGLLHFRLGLDSSGLLWSGVLTAVVVSSCSLGLGAAYLLRQLRVSPAQLLRSGG